MDDEGGTPIYRVELVVDEWYVQMKEYAVEGSLSYFFRPLVLLFCL